MVEKTLNDLFYDTLKDIYFAERQILKTLPKLAKAAKSEELKSAFLTHRDETEGQVDRLQTVFEMIGKRPQTKTCEAIKGILEEGDEIMQEYAGSEALDAGLLAGGQALRNVALWHAKDLGDAARHERCSGAPRSDSTGGEEDRRPSQQIGAGESQSESRVRRSGIRSCEWVGGSAGLFSLPLTGDDLGAGNS
jgi:ferritin-like metal-binding protein YciE